MYRVEWKYHFLPSWNTKEKFEKVQLNYALGFLEGLRFTQEYFYDAELAQIEFRIVNNKTGEIWEED